MTIQTMTLGYTRMGKHLEIKKALIATAKTVREETHATPQ